MRLYSQEQSGHAICPATIIGNRAVKERQYPIVEHVVVLDNQPRDVLQHDYLALVQQSGYRPMTPAEQNVYRKKQEAQSTVEEGQA